MGNIGTNPRRVEATPLTTKPIRQPRPAPATPAPATPAPSTPAPAPAKEPAPV